MKKTLFTWMSIAAMFLLTSSCKKSVHYHQRLLCKEWILSYEIGSKTTLNEYHNPWIYGDVDWTKNTINYIYDTGLFYGLSLDTSMHAIYNGTSTPDAVFVKDSFHYHSSVLSPQKYTEIIAFSKKGTYSYSKKSSIDLRELNYKGTWQFTTNICDKINLMIDSCWAKDSIGNDISPNIPYNYIYSIKEFSKSKLIISGEFNFGVGAGNYPETITYKTTKTLIPKN